MSNVVATFTDQNWESEVVGSAQPVLVDFWAEWCGPCRALAPTLDAIATQYSGRLKVGKLNVEQNADIPIRYAITALSKAGNESQRSDTAEAGLP